MNTQFKKGVLELIVLLSVYKKDMYGYELVSESSKLSESKEGSSRKYYRITANGKNRTKELLNEWKQFE